MQLAALDSAFAIDDMDVSGYRLHRLKGQTKNRWSIWVGGNWRLTFEFTEGDVELKRCRVYFAPAINKPGTFS